MVTTIGGLYKVKIVLRNDVLVMAKIYRSVHRLLVRLMKGLVIIVNVTIEVAIDMRCALL